MTRQMPRMQVHIDGGQALRGELTVEANNEVLWSDLPRPNPTWTYTDQQGHPHYYGPGDTLPTLDARSEHADCDGVCALGGCEGYSIQRYSCPLCGEEITPGFIEGPHAVVIEGAPSWSLRVHGWSDSHMGQRVQVEIDHQSGRKLSGSAEVVGQAAEGFGSDWVTLTTDLVGVSELVEVP